MRIDECIEGEAGDGTADATLSAVPEHLEADRAEFVRIVPEHIERLERDREFLRAFQTARLRALLATARERSPFHAPRLAGIDPATFELGDLASLPVMTKAEMMAELDDVVTDRRLSQAGMEEHLSGVGEHVVLHLDEYLVLVSGGSSGVRGMYAYNRAELVEYLAAVLRPGMAKVSAIVGWPPPAPLPVAIAAAPTTLHATRATPVLTEGQVNDITFAPVTLPFDTIVARVQEAQPLLLVGYPSMVARLADAQREGRLSITPMMVLATSEQLTAELSERIAAGFGAPPGNTFGSSEGLHGSAAPGSDVFDFASDLAVIEFVDDEDRPVEPGTTADHVLVTNLFNHTQPLIRYRIDDRMTQMAPSETHGHQRARVEGRTDDVVRIAGVDVHPLTFRTTMLSFPEIAEYQVRVGDAEIVLDVVAVAGGSPVLEAIEHAVRTKLEEVGVPPMPISARPVDAVRRDPYTGKVRRFLVG
jgi:phenylacetate-CoA ligase